MAQPASSDNIRAMPIAYFDCFSGAAGDMILAAMIDAGLPVDFLQDLLRRLKLPGVTLTAEKVKRHGLSATHVNVVVAPEAQKKHRHLHHILQIIDAAELPPTVAARAKAVFQRLAEAEAAVHGTSVEKVHFHEVGAADAIADIVGACAGFERLGLTRIFCSPIPTGHGTVTCEHGVMPVPAPATALLLREIPLADCEETGELITPTGAAILATAVERFGRRPPMRVGNVGVGAGTREGRTRPNILRLFVGEPLESAAGQAGPSDDDPSAAGAVAVLECQVDDATGQALAYACERLLAAGALDAFLTPILMKKGRPAHLLTVLCRPAETAAIEALIFAETTTFGVRRTLHERTTLAREHVRVRLELPDASGVRAADGSSLVVRMKVGRLDGRVVQAWPEYDDCAAAAAATGRPLREVQQAALAAWARMNADRGG